MVKQPLELIHLHCYILTNKQAHMQLEDQKHRYVMSFKHMQMQS